MSDRGGRLRIVTINFNGVRAAWRKGFLEWLQAAAPDIVCAQELKARADDLSESMRDPAGLRGYFRFAERPGYSGVAIYARAAPRRVERAVLRDAEFDCEGRLLELFFGGFSVVSLYMPSGSSGAARQAVKYRAMEKIFARFEKRRGERVICGDLNIAHTQKDIRNWRGNLKNSGFLPEEREWLTRFLGDAGYVDVFRRLNDNDGEYTWWSNRGRARENNVGWRIDYQLATPAFAARAQAAAIERERFFSDHAPLTIDYKIGD